MDLSIKIGGEAGQGIQTIGDLLTKIFARTGFYVFTHQDYESRVRGGHNFYQIRFSDKPVFASRSQIDIIVGFDEDTITLHRHELKNSGILIFDPTVVRQSYDDPQFLSVPFGKVAAESSGNAIMANTVATGVILGMLGLPVEALADALPVTLKKKTEKNIADNIAAAKRGYEYARKYCKNCVFSLSSRSEPLMSIDTNQAIGLGAGASGCKFYSAYPMTPSTGIMTALAQRSQEFGIIVEQAEDEIAAINMAIGASFAGVRAMTGTSGGGFSLMVEGLSLAAMTETPIVIVLGQRPGPATGLPTRTEQGELLFALHAGHGEFPRIIFAPGTAEQACFLTNKAFDLSQKFQIPVFILTDQYLADSQWTYKSLDSERLAFTNYRVVNIDEPGERDYKRHALTENGISPFAVPGKSRNLVITDSDEHDETGHITEDAVIREKMVLKRNQKKISDMLSHINPPDVYGAKNPEIVVTGWGSSYGIMREAVDMLSSSGKSIAALHFREIYPFPETREFD
ncbi:MAG TPA: 2-oxoacid:acceptor oxidoreductase subunit alpha [Syntrophorhabdaceae bacterium]|nr:2-oxoacid:acceptor oxidoreductase subunit alpha [Syntrophorhabdaceae bacterium]